MKTCALCELINSDFNLAFLNALRQFWRGKREFSCLGKPKEQCLLLLLDGCRATYTDKAGHSLTGESGDIIYVPRTSEYRAVFHDFEDDTASTVGVNFLLFSSDGVPLRLSERIEVIHPASRTVREVLRRLSDEEAALDTLQKRILLLEALHALSQSNRESGYPALILPGLRILTEHPEQMTPIGELARLSNVSEVYFRKHFKAAFGVSPVEYRNRLRLERARDYLEYGDVSVQEISDMMGYATVSHFIKAFRRAYGASPLAYRRARRGGERKK